MFLELKDFIKRGRENKEGNGGRLKSLPVFVAFNSQLHPLRGVEKEDQYRQ